MNALIKSVYALSLTSIAFAATGCGSAATPNLGNGGADVAQTSASASKLPKVKYPAAIVFEGGEGDSWFDGTGEKHTPKWRLYICLPSTEQPVSGQAVVDLNRLGTPVEKRSVYEATKELAFAEKLDQVTLNYSYTANLKVDEIQGIALGRASIAMTSVQPWENAAQFAHVDRRTIFHEDLELFNLDTNKGGSFQFSQFKYDLDGKDHYISARTLTFGYLDGKVAMAIDACEKADQAQVLQVGSQITPLVP